MSGNLKSKIEALLFVSGDEMTIRRLSRVLEDASEQDIETALAELVEEYRSRGVHVLVKGGKVQMVTAPEHAELLGALVKSHLTEELTPATLETLACVAYHEPIAKTEIDSLRGVNCIISLRSLAMRGLVEKGKNDMYQVSLDFLKKLGVEKVSDLPDYDVFHNVPAQSD